MNEDLEADTTRSASLNTDYLEGEYQFNLEEYRSRSQYLILDTAAHSNNKTTRNNYDDPTSKIWSVYVSEAASFDKALVEGWTRDMDGILIFVSADSSGYSLLQIVIL